MTVTTETCFNSSDFTQWWNDVNSAADSCWDDGVMLDILIELYNEGCPIPDAAAEALEAYEIGQAEAIMSIPSWA